MKYTNIAYVASDHIASQKLLKDLNLTLSTPNEKSDLIVVIGGDGTLLHSIHEFMHLNIPFYGINSGTVGFLMNHYNKKKDINLFKSLENLRSTDIHPLKLKAFDIEGKSFSQLAVNEVSIYRNTQHIIKFKIKVDGQEHITISGDGLIVCTPAGSSAYNFSAGGRIIPLGTNLLSVTPICAFRPRRWHGALLHSDSVIELVMDQRSAGKVNGVADFNEFYNIERILISEDKTHNIKLLFDNDNSLEERFIKEQFLY